MKLKKIASLAMAGALAVSMLAGCSTTGTVTPNQPSTPATSVSANVDALVNQPAYVTFADSTELDAALKDAVEYAGVMDVMPDYVNRDVLTGVAPDVSAVLDNEVGVTTMSNGTLINLWNIGQASTLLDAEQQDSYTIPDAVAAQMYVVSSTIGQKAIEQQIATILNGIPAYEYSGGSTDGSTNEDGGNYNHTYTVSISTCTKTVNSSISGDAWGFEGAANPSVTFVAVQVVRTSTHQ